MSQESDKGQTGDQSQAGAAGSTSATKEQNAEGKAAEGEPTDRFLTKEVFTSSLGHWRRTVKEDLDKIQKQTQESVGALVAAEIAKALEQSAAKGKSKAKSKDGEGSAEGDPNDLELTSLKRQLEEAQKSHETLRAELTGERTKAQEFTKKFKAVDALRRFDCTRPEVVYGVIQNELKLSEDGQNVFVVLKDEWQNDVQVSIDDYVRGEVSQKIVPELFKGANRGGTPAGGDTGGSTGKYKFTVEQIRDPEFYQKNRDAISVAMQRGEIKGINQNPMTR